MRKIKFNLKNCYGIRSLEQQLEFENRTFAIYAPNGVMKTSFAKTMYDISKDNTPSDLVFPDRNSIHEIFIDEQTIAPKSIFVIESYNPDYKSDKISTLLANKDLKEEYDEIHKDIDKATTALTKKLKQLSGLTGRKDSIETTIEKIFGRAFYDIIIELESQIADSSKLPFNEIKYKIIFNDNVEKFLETKDFRQSLEEYIRQYDELIESSPYLGKEFKFHHAEAVQKQLVSNNFFKGKHSINLFDGSQDNKCSSDDELLEILKSEKEKVFSDDKLKSKFDEISNKLSNKELKEFRDYLLDNQEILPEISDLSEFSKRLWLSYFVDQKDLFLDLAKKYKSGQNTIQNLVNRAKEEKTDWEEVIRIFNTRFSHLPFQLKIKNKEDVILKSDVETIEFIFKEGQEEKLFSNKNELLKILSTGEQRALYILNIIFEIEARKKEDGETLFIVDDIADSFDYKNKYAIIEYLKHISEYNSFYMIVLTHNFDFFRTIQSRGISTYKQCLIAIKNDTGIRLEKIQYLKNPFINDWKNNLNDNKKLIASIPFIRNLIEYTQGTQDEDYLLLTSVLHYKNVTKDITVENVGQIFKNCISGISFPTFPETEKVIDLIFSVAESCLNADEGINLENKIVLSIAIRLRSEQFMASKITDQQFLSDIGLNQNWKLLRKYEEEYNNKRDSIEILKRVNLITPENIHVNSFMYEPILDMGDGELRELYKTVRDKLTYEES
jgi:hypothetical protein